MKYCSCYLSWHLLQSFVFTQNEILIIAVPPPPGSFQGCAASALQYYESVFPGFWANGSNNDPLEMFSCLPSSCASAARIGSLLVKSANLFCFFSLFLLTIYDMLKVYVFLVYLFSVSGQDRCLLLVRSRHWWQDCHHLETKTKAHKECRMYHCIDFGENWGQFRVRCRAFHGILISLGLLIGWLPV